MLAQKCSKFEADVLLKEFFVKVNFEKSAEDNKSI